MKAVLLVLMIGLVVCCSVEEIEQVEGVESVVEPIEPLPPDVQEFIECIWDAKEIWNRGINGSNPLYTDRRAVYDHGEVAIGMIAIKLYELRNEQGE